jgi:glutathione synthase/RimK-type ligase-like ATP-grasp enzyme
MKVGIHLQGHSAAIPITPFERKFIEILEFNKISYVILNINDFDFWNKVKEIDYFIFRFGELSSEFQLAGSILPIIEKQLGIKCFPNHMTAWHFNDKVKQYYLLHQFNAPITQSWIFWNKNKCLQWLEVDATYPLVFKLKGGAGSANVVLLKNFRQAKKVVNRIFTKGIKDQRIPLFDSVQYRFFDLKQYFLKALKKVGRYLKGWEIERNWPQHKGYALFQKYLPGNDYDTRVLVIGKRAFAFRRFNRKDDFRSSGSGLIDHNPLRIDLEHLKNAFEVSSKLNFQSMAYDFLYNENGGSEFCEISYSYIDIAVFQCPGYWDINLNWHEGHYWPQYFICMDLLGMPALKQPDLNPEDYVKYSSYQTFKKVFLKK